MQCRRRSRGSFAYDVVLRKRPWPAWISNTEQSRWLFIIQSTSLTLKVNERTKVPLASVFVVFICGILISLINIGSSTAFNDVVSLVLEGFYTSYLLACGMLLYRRVRDEICDLDSETLSELQICWGPWHLKGPVGIANNIVACAYLILIAFFSFWPAATPVTAVTMNYSSLVLGIVTITSMVYYILWARKTYKGPIVEVKLSHG